MSHQYQFNVKMACSGCSNSVSKALGKLDGVTDTKISLESQTVDVTTNDALDYDAVYNTIAKTGKQVIDGKTIS
ncbi:hypothetical protein FT663_02013 [Candidozyma haemuli var. vulneris]|nr:hypothetical protein FT662_01472 [[Candida] haemuloni var. vulneris]KAF3993182.1 hypothetical protein FT663_02013 [[Candida] haemuloni var. vulneris]